MEGNKRQPPKKMSFNWIYEREEDERTRNPEGKKIFVMFDFPQILQSALGSLQVDTINISISHDDHFDHPNHDIIHG